MGYYHSDSCNLCLENNGERFSSWEEHRLHIRKFHNDSIKFVCGICNMIFDDVWERGNHRVKEHSDYDPTTYENFLEILPRLANIYNISIPQDFTSLFLAKGKCRETSEKIAKLYRYSRKQYAMVSCKICNKEMILGMLSRHIIYAHHGGARKCKICKFPAKSQEDYEEHMKSHNSMSCEFCGREFYNIKNLRDHIIRIHTPDSEKPFRCSVCPKGFSSRRNLQDHVNTHTNARPYKCAYEGCSSAFNNISLADAHYKAVHLGIKNPNRRKPLKKSTKKEQQPNFNIEEDFQQLM